VIVLEYHHELLRDLLHYKEDIIGEPMPLCPLVDVYPLHLADDLPQPLDKLSIVTPRFIRNVAALVLAGLFPNLGAIADDVDINLSEGVFSADAVERHLDDFSAGVGGYRTSRYYN
jgi:hypothetical protein